MEKLVLRQFVTPEEIKRACNTVSRDIFFENRAMSKVIDKLHEDITRATMIPPTCMENISIRNGQLVLEELDAQDVLLPGGGLTPEITEMSDKDFITLAISNGAVGCGICQPARKRVVSRVVEPPQISGG